MNSSHSYKYQQWLPMTIFFILAFLSSTYFSTKLTWGLFNENDWGDFDRHLPYIKNFFWLIFPLKNASQWNLYWMHIKDENLEFSLYLHLTIPFLMSLGFSIFVTKKILWVKGGRDNIIHIKGAKLYCDETAIAHAKKTHKRELKNSKHGANGVKIHPDITISTLREQGNMVVLGTTGAGKSTVIKPLVMQAIDRGDYLFIYDEKKEYTQIAYQAESTILLAPWDSRSPRWEISKDVNTKSTAALFAAAFVSNKDASDQMWIKGAQLIFTGMIIYLINRKEPWGWPEIAQMLKMPQAEMIEIINIHYPIATSFIVENSKTTQGFYVNLVSSLDWIDDLAVAWPSSSVDGFSMRQWVRHETSKKVLIVQSDPVHTRIGKPLCNALISLMTQYFLALEESSTRKT